MFGRHYVLPPFTFACACAPSPLTFSTPPVLGSNGTLVGFSVSPLGSNAGALLERFDVLAGMGIGDGLDPDEPEVLLPVLFCEPEGGVPRLKWGTE